MKHKLYILFLILPFIIYSKESEVKIDTTVQNKTFRKKFIDILDRTQTVSQKAYITEENKLYDNMLFTRTDFNGWYMLGGVGYSLLNIDAPGYNRDFYPMGMNISSSLGYVTEGLYSFEFGSFIDLLNIDHFNSKRFEPLDPLFKEVDEVEGINWNTIFYLGIRARIPGLKVNNDFNPYMKVFYGRGVSVLFLDTDDHEVNKTIDDRRFQFEGFVFGFSLSNIFNMFNDKPLWYAELTFSTQMTNEYFYVEEAGELPTEIKNDATNDSSLFYLLRLTIGSRFF